MTYIHDVTLPRGTAKIIAVLFNIAIKKQVPGGMSKNTQKYFQLNIFCIAIYIFYIKYLLAIPVARGNIGNIDCKIIFPQGGPCMHEGYKRQTSTTPFMFRIDMHLVSPGSFAWTWIWCFRHVPIPTRTPKPKTKPKPKPKPTTIMQKQYRL